MKITFQALVMQMTSCNKCIVQKSGHSLCKRREKILSIFPPKTLAQYVLPLIVLLASKRANTTFIYFKDLVLLATLFSKIVHTFWLFRKCLDAFRLRGRYGLFPFTSGLPRVKGKNNSQRVTKAHLDSPRVTSGEATSDKWRI